MKAAIFRRFGPAEVLQIAEMGEPAPGDDEVLVRVASAGLNPVDTKIRSGTHISCKDLKLPAIPGKEISGVVASVGRRVKGLLPGDPVLAFLPANGACAELAITHARLVVKKPENISFELAAAIPLAGMTAFQAIHEHLHVSSGEHLLVQAAAGGVGHLAVQFAKIVGALVSGTASAKNEDFLRKIGVDQPIDYETERFEEIVAGVDAVLDAMGGEVLYRSISCVKPGGRVVCLPSSTRDDPRAIAFARERKVDLVWPMMQPREDQLQEIIRLFAEEKIHLETDGVFPLKDIMEAHRAMESHHTRGKNVIQVNESQPPS